MKKIVVFGATGNLGAYISVHMKEQGYDVIAVGHRKMIITFCRPWNVVLQR